MLSYRLTTAESMYLQSHVTQRESTVHLMLFFNQETIV